MDLFKKALANLNRKGDGDTIDRLSATTTVGILLVATIFVTAGQFVVQPIQCFVPAEMTDAMHQYVEKYCYIQDTYFVPYTEYVPQIRRSIKRKDQVVSYYQWVPFILLLQAVMFYAPRLFWRVMSSFSGTNFNAMLTMARECLFCDGDKRDSCYQALVDYLNWALDLRRAAGRRSPNCDLFGLCSSLYLTVIFLLTKALYVTNAIGQIFLLNALLQTNDPFYGINMVRALVNGTQWQQSGFFPRSTLCDVEIRDVANINRYTIQCVLVLNVFHEKLFIFLWFWTMLVFVASACSLVFRLFSSFFPGNRRRFIRRLLPELPVEKDHPLAEALTEFVDDYLGIHGVFLLRSISDRVGVIVAGKVVNRLWRNFIRGLRDPCGTFAMAEEEKRSRSDQWPIENENLQRSISNRQYGVSPRDGYAPFRGANGSNGIRTISTPSFPHNAMLRRRETNPATSSACDQRSALV